MAQDFSQQTLPAGEPRDPESPDSLSLPPQDVEKERPENGDPETLTRLETSHSAMSPPKSAWKETLFITTVCMAQFMTQAGLAVAIVPGAIIGKSFNLTSPGQLSWFPAAYSLTVGTFILVAGRLGDLYGHRLMFIIGFTWFGLWSLLAGFSVWSSPVFFDCCRAFQGIGPAMLLPNAVAIFGQTYPPGRKKGFVFSLFGACAPGGYVVGGVFSSIFAQLVWWPWGYWIMGIVCFILAGMGFLVIPSTPSPKKDDSINTVERLDLYGAAAGISGLVLINFAWNQAPLVGWKTPYTYAMLIVGILLLVAFGFIEKSAPRPLLPREALKGDLAWVLGCIAAGWSSFGVMIYYFFQFNMVIKGNTGLLATAKFSGAAVSGAIASVVTGFLLNRFSPSIIMFCAMAAFTTGLALLATAPVNQTYWAQIFLTSIITPWGMYVHSVQKTPKGLHYQHQARLLTLLQGHVFPFGYPSTQQLNAPASPRTRSLPRQHHGQLFHLARSRIRSHRGNTRKRRRKLSAQGIPGSSIHGSWSRLAGIGGVLLLFVEDLEDELQRVAMTNDQLKENRVI